MTQAGGRGPAAPKPPMRPMAPSSPTAPTAPGPGAGAPRAPAAAPAAVDESWDDVDASEDSTTLVGTPRSGEKVDVAAVARATVEPALVPILKALGDLDRRLEALERLAAAATRAPAPPHVPMPVPAPALAPAPAPAPALTPAPAPDPHPSAMATPRAIVSHPPTPSFGPLLDVAAIERDIPLDFSPFDARRRRRRLVVALSIAIVLLFGGLFAMLAQSYMPK